MTPSELDQLRKQLVRTIPALGPWHSEQAHRLASMNGTTADEEADAMRGVWLSAFRDVELPHAQRVVEQFAAGLLPIPPYSDLCPVICREAAAVKNAVYRDEPRVTFRCLTCRDVGTVDVYNVKWVAENWERIVDGTLPEGWPRIAQMELKERNTVLSALVICNCECKNAQIYRSQHQRWLDEQRGGVVNPSRPARTAYYRIYDPDQHCMRRECSAAQMAGELKAWCDSHPREFGGNWTPDPQGYERATHPRGGEVRRERVDNPDRL